MLNRTMYASKDKEEGVFLSTHLLLPLCLPCSDLPYEYNKPPLVNLSHFFVHSNNKTVKVRPLLPTTKFT